MAKIRKRHKARHSPSTEGDQAPKGTALKNKRAKVNFYRMNPGLLRRRSQVRSESRRPRQLKKLQNSVDCLGAFPVVPRSVAKRRYPDRLLLGVDSSRSVIGIDQQEVASEEVPTPKLG